MTYDKETRKEIMEDEIREDKIKEISNEIDDGALDQYINENYNDLSRDFCMNYFNDEFRSYAKDKFKETNE